MICLALSLISPKMPVAGGEAGVGVTEVPVSVGLPGSNSLAAEAPARKLEDMMDWQPSTLCI